MIESGSEMVKFHPAISTFYMTSTKQPPFVDWWVAFSRILSPYYRHSTKFKTTFFYAKPQKSQNTHFLALSFRKLCSSSSFWVPISRRRVVNLFCHSLQWLSSANFSGELSRSTKSMLSTVSSF